MSLEQPIKNVPLFKPLTDRNLINFLWILTAATMCFFGVPYPRIDIGALHLALPMLTIGASMLFGILVFFIPQGKLRQKARYREYSSIIAVSVIFFLWHAFAMIPTVSVDLAAKEVIKIMMGLMGFIIVILLFPRDKAFFEKFMIITMYGWMGLLIRLIYQYAFVFKSSFLSTGLTTIDRYGKGTLAVHLAVFFLYGFYLLFFSKKKLLVLPPATVMAVALIYSTTRMAWIAVIVALVATIFSIFKMNQKLGLKIFKNLIIGLTVMLVLGVTVMARYVNFIEVLIRLESIYNPSAIDPKYEHLGKNSYNNRMDIIHKAWDAFLTAPVTGVGLGNTRHYVGPLTHNDFMGILLEMGIIGLLIFLTWLYVIGKKLWIGRVTGAPKITWILLASQGGYIALVMCLPFINVYSSIHYWIYMAFFIVGIEIEKDLLIKNGNLPAVNTSNPELKIRL